MGLPRPGSHVVNQVAEGCAQSRVRHGEHGDGEAIRNCPSVLKVSRWFGLRCLGELRPELYF